VLKALRMAAENPGCTGLLGAPTIPMLKSVTIRAMLETLESHNMPFDYRSQFPQHFCWSEAAPQFCFGRWISSTGCAASPGSVSMS
jgi:hypothetical protein